MEAQERGENYSFDQENEDTSSGGKQFFFLLIMTIILVSLVLLRIGFLIIDLFI